MCAKAEVRHKLTQRRAVPRPGPCSKVVRAGSRRVHMRLGEVTRSTDGQCHHLERGTQISAKAQSITLSITGVCEQRQVAWVSGKTVPSHHLGHRVCWRLVGLSASATQARSCLWANRQMEPQGLLGADSRIIDWAWGSRSETHMPDSFWKKRNEGNTLIMTVPENL